MTDPNRPAPGLEYEAMKVILGDWINKGQTVEDQPKDILTSDVYRLMPGGFFILHTAYGRFGGMDVGGTEIIGYDQVNKTYVSYFFDSQGNVSTDELKIEGNVWTWTGKTTRCRAEFTENNTVQTAHHERLDESGQWVPSMDVVLYKVS